MLLLVLVLVVAIVLAGKYLVIPSIVEGTIRGRLSSWWDGRVEIDGVEFNFLSPSRVRGLALFDNRGRCWVRLDKVEAKVSGILALEPTVGELVLDGLVVTAHFDDGRCALPLRIPSDARASELSPESYPDIHIRGAAFVLSDGSGDEWRWEDIDLQTRWPPGRPAPEVRVSRFSEGSGDWLTLQGTVHPGTSEAKLMLALTHTIERREAAEILGSLEATAVTDAEAALTANLSVRGRLKDPGSLEVHGTVSLNDLVCWSGGDQVNSDMDIGIRFFGREAQIAYANLITPVFTVSLGKVRLAYEGQDNNIVVRIGDGKLRFPKREEYGPFWEELLGRTSIEGWANFSGMVVLPTRPGRSPLELFEGEARLARLALPTGGLLELTDLYIPKLHIRNTEVKIPRLSCRTCGGQATGHAEMSIYPFTYEVVTGVESLAAGQVARSFRLSAKLQKGTISGRLIVGGTGFELAGFHLNSLLLAEDVDVEVDPLFIDMFRTMGVRPDSVRSTTDLAAAFHIDYPIMTFERGRLANRASAMDIEPGGTIDLSTGDIDFYVVGGSLNDIRSSLLRPTANMTKRFTRLRVYGNVSDPPSKLIQKEVLEDLAGGTVEFFVGSAKAGGELGGRMLRFFGPPPSDIETEEGPGSR